ncbi:hypothetical protein M0804_007657 [Polistes exclamans]|nr:hypothetical protein M0804_007657 [Polistes exclamans]
MKTLLQWGRKVLLPVYEKRYIPLPGSSKGGGRLLGNEEFKKGMVVRTAGPAAAPRSPRSSMVVVMVRWWVGGGWSREKEGVGSSQYVRPNPLPEDCTNISRPAAPRDLGAERLINAS